MTLLGCVSLYTLLGAERRRQLLNNPQLHHKMQASLVAAALTLSMVPTKSSATEVPTTPETNPIFDGSPFWKEHTWQRLTALIDTVLPKVLEAVRENEQFYDQLMTNLRTAVRENVLLTSHDAHHTHAHQ